MQIEYKDKQRFFEKTRIQNDCIIWTGTIGKDGLGRMSLKGKTTLTHKIAFWLKHNREPNSFLVHTCDNLSCVNPDHIVEGKNKGRPVTVSAQKIIELKNEGLTPSQIADAVGCSVSLVRKRLKV